MKSRYLLRTLACAAATLAVLVGPALADELIGRITAVDVEAKKFVVTEKRTDKEVEVTIDDETEFESPKGKSKPDLNRMKKQVEKSKKGIAATITHDKGVASKIVVKGRKKEDRNKEEPKKDDGEEPKKKDDGR